MVRNQLQKLRHQTKQHGWQTVKATALFVKNSANMMVEFDITDLDGPWDQLEERLEHDERYAEDGRKRVLARHVIKEARVWRALLRNA